MHVVLDHVQFEKNSFVNRNRVRTVQGATWLTVPVETSGRFGRLPIRDVAIAGSIQWQRKHWETLRQAYGKSPHFRDHDSYFEGVYSRTWGRLAELCSETTDFLCGALGISTRRVSSSTMTVSGTKDDLLLAICKALGATTYLSGALGRQYVREELFTAEGIEVRYQDYRHPTYPQQFDPFVPSLSVVDLLFNCGPASLDVILSTPA